MSSAAPMQQAKTDAPQKSAQHTSQSSAQSNQAPTGGMQGDFADHRPQAAAQRRLQDAVHNSEKSRQFKAFQNMVQSGTQAMQLKNMGAMMSAATLRRLGHEQPLQAKFAGKTAQRKAAADASKSNNTGLPENLKSGIESLSGMSMDHVKVHYNSSQPAQLNAHAYAQGSEIHLAPGQERHLPHEAWHVVQQAQGRVKPTIQMKDGVRVNDDGGLEREADVMGANALRQGTAQLARQANVGVLEPASTPQTHRRQNAPRQFQLDTALPAGDFYKAAITEAMRTEMRQSRDTFNAAKNALQVQKDVLAGFAIPTPVTDELFTVTRAANRLLGYLDGRFSDTKKRGLRADHGVVSDAEESDLIGRARSEIDDLYPIAYVPQGNTLNKKLKGIFNAAAAADQTIPLAVPRALIRAASAQDKAAAAGNERLLENAKNQIQRGDFEHYVIELGVVQQGAVAQTPAAHADELIRTQMATWAPAADIGGRRIAGNVAILKGDAWAHLVRSIYAGRLPGGEIANLINVANAFEREGRVYINADRGNAGTMIHEGVHKYAPNTFLNTYGEPLNEGVTEYFARQICAAQDPPIGRTQYPANVLAAQQLVADAGEANVRRAYFLGDVAALAGVPIPNVP